MPKPWIAAVIVDVAQKSHCGGDLPSSGCSLDFVRLPKQAGLITEIRHHEIMGEPHGDGEPLGQHHHWLSPKALMPRLRNVLLRRQPKTDMGSWYGLVHLGCGAVQLGHWKCCENQAWYILGMGHTQPSEKVAVVHIPTKTYIHIFVVGSPGKQDFDP